MNTQRKVARVARVIKNKNKNIYTIYEKNKNSVNSDDTSLEKQIEQKMHNKKTTFNKIFNENQRTYKNQTQRSRSNSNLSQAETVKNYNQNNNTPINFQLLMKNYTNNELNEILRKNLNELNIIKKLGKKVFVEEPGKVFHLIYSIYRNENNNYVIQYYSPIETNVKRIRKIILTDDEATELKKLMTKKYYSKPQNNNIYKNVRKSRKNGSKKATHNITLTENTIRWKSGMFSLGDKVVSLKDVKEPTLTNSVVEFSVGDNPHFGYKLYFQNDKTAQKFFDLIIAYKKPNNSYGHQ